MNRISGMGLLCTVACAIAALLCLGNMLKRDKSHANILLALLMADIAASLGLSAARYAADPDMTRAPRAFLSLLALSGIFINLLFLDLARTDSDRRRFQFLPFLLLIPASLSDLLVYAFDAQGGGIRALLALIRGLHLGVASIVFLLYAGSIFHVFKLYSPKTMTKSAWTILAVSIAATIALMSGFVGIALGDTRFIAFMDGFISFAVVAVALLDYRYPGALGRFREETVKRRYAKSLLAGLDVEGLKSGMIEMMKRTSLYRDEALDLDELSRRVGLSAHQVSELLNDRMSTNFSAFINGFRIDAAKELIVARPGMTMLEVAMEVGFGNKTSFNEAFKRRVRMTPRQFRDSVGEKRQER
jgi:AraC-like DNA-binding protein